MKTVFVSREEWGSDRVELEGASYHHLFRAARLAVGESLRVADGAGSARLGVVERVTRAQAEIALGAEVPGNEPRVEIQLLVVAPKKPRAEWLVEKATELGVGAVRLLRSDRGPRSYGEGAFERLHRIARSAAEQCARARVPLITGMHEADEVEGFLRGSAAAFVLDPSGPRLAPSTSAESISLLIGPEGGWTSAEVAAFESLGVRRAGLGPRILRVETAAIAALFACVASD